MAWTKFLRIWLATKKWKTRVGYLTTFEGFDKDARQLCNASR